MRRIDKGILVTEVMGQGVNLVTGDYSRGASGFWIENGVIRKPLQEFTIAGNLAKSELRRRKRWRLFSLHRDSDSDTGIELPDESFRPDKVAESSMTDVQIQDAIRSLPENYRQVILLRDVEGMSYQEIAEIVDCPVGTVKSRVNRARIKLQQKLRQEGRDVGLEV